MTKGPTMTDRTYPSVSDYPEASGADYDDETKEAVRDTGVIKLALDQAEKTLSLLHAQARAVIEILDPALAPQRPVPAEGLKKSADDVAVQRRSPLHDRVEELTRGMDALRFLLGDIENRLEL